MTKKSPEKIVDGLNFCVLDLETTGGNPGKDKIIEIGMVKVRNRQITEEKSFLINPEIPIPDFIQKLTRISQKSVKNAPKIEEVMHDILAFIGSDIIVAHNTSFDVPFLNGILKKMALPELQNKVICTNVMTKHLIPEILSSNLNYMSRLFDIGHSKAHRAHDDALATAHLLIIYLSIFVEKGIKKINQLYYPRNKFELDRIHFSEKTTNEEVLAFFKDKNTSYLVTIKGERGLILAVIPLENPSEEMDIINQVLKDIPWTMITVKLLKPFIEGLFQFNNHFYKYSEEIRSLLLNYLMQRYTPQDDKIKKVEQYDFVLAHHLVSDQVMVYSFLHLNTNSKHIFRIPAQKKKLYQYLNNQMSRFETNHKGRKKHLIHNEIVPLIENFLNRYKGQSKYLLLDRKTIRQDKDGSINVIESFVKDDINDFNFPTEHL